MTTEELVKAAERVRGSAMNPHLGLNEWYPVHPGDDAGVMTQRRAFYSDIIAVAEHVIAAATRQPGGFRHPGLVQLPDGRSKIVHENGVVQYYLPNGAAENVDCE